MCSFPPGAFLSIYSFTTPNVPPFIYGFVVDTTNSSSNSPSVSTPVVSFFNATPALFTILPASSALSFIIKFPPLFIVYVSFTPVIVFPFILRVISCPSNTSTLSFVSVTISIVH